MDDVYENIYDYNPLRKKKNVIVFVDMIVDIMANNEFKPIIKELFIRCRKLNISLVFMTQSFFSAPKDVRLNSTHYLIMNINNTKLQDNYKILRLITLQALTMDFMEIYGKCTKETYSFLTIDTRLPASNPLRFRKNLFSSL